MRSPTTVAVRPGALGYGINDVNERRVQQCLRHPVGFRGPLPAQPMPVPKDRAGEKEGVLAAHDEVRAVETEDADGVLPFVGVVAVLTAAQHQEQVITRILGGRVDQEADAVSIYGVFVPLGVAIAE
ncbi:hypothetical protein KBP30_40895 [Streptomyces sp. Go40/10]|uniref:hypothetical protein n=1 Tax=Streptomyces sp. Go40/10 TaxID=2825844 RepID=UPI001E41A53F|nr:hypothetical protein [Streptomyces sp. Go40/10]UFR07107.1 hypothetical protein KBP30_40895 [Streptomyces sp. Go40/10]